MTPKELMKKRESQTIEFKKSLAERKEILETISAFATREGGIIYVGVEEDKDGSIKEIVGVDVKGKVVETLTNEIKQNTDPVIFPSVKIEKVENKEVLSIEVKESLVKPVFTGRNTFIRVGRTNRRLSSQEIGRMAKESAGYNFTELVCEEGILKDIDKEKIKWFVKEARKQRNLKLEEDMSLNEVLMRLKLLKDNKLTNAAVLLFGKDPQNFFLQAEVKCIRFKGIDVTGPMIDLKVIEGDIINQLKKAEEFIFDHIPLSAWLEDRKLQRQEKWLYPPTAIREALANALTHRDYGSPAKVQVRIFDDRMEIWNPGKLPRELTVEKLKKKHNSFPKNPLIARTFFWIKFIEEVGTGTNKIIRWCNEWGLPEPLFEDTKTSFILTFKKYFISEEILDKLNERQKKAIEYLKENKKVTSKKYAELYTITDRMARNDLKELLIKKIIRKKGTSDKTTYYVLAEI